MRLREFGSQSHGLVRDGPSIGPPAVGFHTNLSPLPRFISNCEQINHGILQIQVIEERRAEMETSWSPFQGFVCRKDQASQRTGSSSSTRTGKTVRTPRWFRDKRLHQYRQYSGGQDFPGGTMNMNPACQFRGQSSMPDPGRSHILQSN